MREPSLRFSLLPHPLPSSAPAMPGVGCRSGRPQHVSGNFGHTSRSPYGCSASPTGSNRTAPYRPLPLSAAGAERPSAKARIQFLPISIARVLPTDPSRAQLRAVAPTRAFSIRPRGRPRAARMCARTPRLASLPRARLPPGPLTRLRFSLRAPSERPLGRQWAGWPLRCGSAPGRTRVVRPGPRVHGALPSGRVRVTLSLLFPASVWSPLLPLWRTISAPYWIFASA